ncbi:MAG: glutamine--fructose-6-phosphate transaminase (isomerizing) [Boseongicola sp. SB0665_bin_10]|nr:glutamine--fructose-6-phosphate transaminase (isomerizing) [Boseongicola sp. SB0665_bin_10]
MCGIVGILGKHEAAPTLVEALKRLEYRGYDSAGIATVNDGALDRRRAVGKLVNLSDMLIHDPLPGKAGIGHTRWATHGAPSVANAHPHRSGRVAVVHNGIIENFRELREELAASGYATETETDTETVSLMAQFHIDEGFAPSDAATRTIARLEGAFALAFLFDGEDDLIVAARRGSPLALGFGDGEMYLGSDAVALGPLTDQISYLEEGDCAVLTRGGAEVRDATGRRANREVRTIRIDPRQIEKDGYQHFMAKEIAEQPGVLADAAQHYIRNGALFLPDACPDFAGVDRIVMVACGTAFYACQTAKYWLESLAGIAVEVDVASEFRYRDTPVGQGTLAIFVSQSGETADTLAALRHVKERARTLCVVNVQESSIARESDVVLPIHAGPEIGVASTKAFTCQLFALLVLALRAGGDRGQLNADALADHLRELQSLPGLVAQALGSSSQIEETARALAEFRDILFLGRGAMYPLAMEGALKLKEVSYIHAEGHSSGELKHGPIALIDQSVPVIVMAPRTALFDKTISNMQEVLARGGRIVLITDRKGRRKAGDGLWRVIELPELPELMAPILYAIPAQLLAYHAAVAKGTDVDQPRNLAKSVTVE